MKPLRVIIKRTIGRLFNRLSTAVIGSLFMAACATFFAIKLEASEGGYFSLPIIWASSLAPILPILAAFLGMDIWSVEKNNRRLDVLLSVPVRERDFVIGKFLGIWSIMLLFVCIFHFATMIFLTFFSPKLLADLPFLSFVPSFFALAIQSAGWTAFVLLSGIITTSAAGSALLSVLVLSVLPRCAWMALLSWAPQGRTIFGEFPFDAHVTDLSSGLISFSIIASYAFCIIVLLFSTSKIFASSRFSGRSAWKGRFSTFVVIILAFATFASSASLVRKIDFSFELPLGLVGQTDFSVRTKGVLNETHGEMVITSFLPRKDPQFRVVAHFMRALEKTSEAQGGIKLILRYVDPNWDLGASERLIRLGVQPGSIVFERGHRLESILLSDGLNERICISAIHRLVSPPQRRSIYWTIGHGENTFLSYDTFGMSTIAREITREGYRNRNLDLATETQVPNDCAAVIVAGAKDEFSRIEIGRLDSYLRQGGRMLVLLASADSVGVSPLLSRWGIRPAVSVYPNARTLSGTDVIATDFAQHAITSPLKGSQIVLEKPVSFSPSAAAETGVGADQIEFTPLANVSGICVSASAERGVGVGDDLSIRPTRIIVLGDAGFVKNGALTLRANANRDFFLNCMAYLSGTDAITETGEEKGLFITGFDRAMRVRFFINFACIYPGIFLVFSFCCILLRRRR